MVWCGLVWCNVVWCSVVWRGVVWCGVVWCGVVWRGVGRSVDCGGIKWVLEIFITGGCGDSCVER